MSEREKSEQPEAKAKPPAPVEAVPTAKATNWGRIRELLMQAQQVESSAGRAITPAEAMEIVQAARAEGISMAELAEFVAANASAAIAAAVRAAISQG